MRFRFTIVKRINIYTNGKNRPFESLDEAEEYISNVLENEEDKGEDYNRYLAEMTEPDNTSDIVRAVWAGDESLEWAFDDYEDKNFDGVIFENVYDSGASGYGHIESNVYVIPNSTQVKSA